MLEKAFPKLGDWEAGDKLPTFKQLESFASRTHTPIGYFFLQEPPDEPLPVPDFRTIRDEAVGRPSPDLLESIYQSEQRQDWYRNYLAVNEVNPPAFLGSASLQASPGKVASQMREHLGFDLEQRATFPTWTDALRGLIEAAERVGVLVVVTGIVGSNTHRKLDPQEFRGFALADTLAPLVFVNGADTKAAQIFTLAHELAHLWAGQSAVSTPELDAPAVNPSERWCNEVAAEFLVPLESLPDHLSGPTMAGDLDRLARRYKVSTLVVLRRLFDRGLIAGDWGTYRAHYREELARVLARAERREDEGGGNFYYTQPYRVSRRFAQAVISQTLEGGTLYRDAYRLLGIRRHETFVKFGEHLGVT
ncbi:ImmA/IrrE family metallo-endopeptidase [Klenkia sp. LSe6-5]|uniref:ImmA/IrrE family metallo-endopeptidase n=1 Tax=Klenkia sesuvii TaxID=3103137 RepID=A0ABU8DXT7_9ACTN